MSTLPWKPWHEVVTLREDVRSGELSLKIFAADLYDVLMNEGPLVYRDPAEFFALTYPTYALRNLARDVMLRLAGNSDKAIRQLELTYGGGKTHTLITMFHLANDPQHLPNLPAVGEFVSHIGFRPPRARIAVLPFDKLDVESGMKVRAHTGSVRTLRHPWSVLAYQIAGDEGLRLLHAEGRAEERHSPPAENLLRDLLSLPARDGLATLILMDEVLMYARRKVAQDPTWRSELVDFFQYLTQAAGKVDRCAIVVSLLASETREGDPVGREVLLELQSILLRESEAGVQPVGKDDVAEVLRRRFFTADSVRDHAAFRQHVGAALAGINALDDQTKREASAAEEHYTRSYPFHPDLTDVFYTKWTGLPRFQRTRGILRTFAMALRDAATWDEAPLIAANVFLTAPDKSGISEATRELAGAAATEDGAGNLQQWSVILESEFAKARELQAEYSALRFRELEQAVLAVFVHSQPIGQKALTRDLLVLLGHTRPDRIELEKGLKRWTEVSWYLDEATAAEEGIAGANGRLPRFWRLGSRPNLMQMHHDACTRVTQLIASRLVEAIADCKSLTSGASSADVRVHTLPKSPAEVEDDGKFHYAVLGPAAASESGKPSAEAERYLRETTNAEKGRVNRNALILAVPSRDGLEAARQAILDYLGWLEVEKMLLAEGQANGGPQGSQKDSLRQELLKAKTKEALQAIPNAIRQAYCIVVAYNERGEPAAFKLPASTEPLFAQIKANSNSRIQETRIEADTLLPGGPYDVWRENESARWVKDLVGAFAQNPKLPRMLNRTAIEETITAACEDGAVVLRLMRPDRTYRTWWRQPVEPATMEESALEAVLPGAAELTSLAPALLASEKLPNLWQDDALPVGDLVRYFSGSHVVQIDRGGYEEPRAIPEAPRSVLDEAIAAAVQAGIIWLVTPIVSFLREEIPAGLITDDAMLRTPPIQINLVDLLPPNLPAGWGLPAPTGNTLAETLIEPTTARALADALSQKAGMPLPWSLVRTAINNALNTHYLERTPESGPWPCDAADASAVWLRVPVATQPVTPQPQPLPPPLPSSAYHARAALQPHEIQALGGSIADLLRHTLDHELRYTLQIDTDEDLPEELVQQINDVLKGVSPDLRLKRGVQ